MTYLVLYERIVSTQTHDIKKSKKEIELRISII